MTNKAALFAAGTVLMLSMGACGATSSGGGSGGGSGSTKHPRVFMEGDGSGFARFANSYETEAVVATQRIAAEDGEVLATILDGQPITTATIKSRNFAEVPPGAEAQNMPAINQAVAQGFAHNFIATFSQHEIVRGSGQLQGLRFAANTPGVTEILLWSDGIVNEPADGFDLSTATDSEVTAEIEHWMPILRGVRHKRVTIVGVGRGVHRVVTVGRAYRLFHAVVEENGGELVWTPTLAQL